MALEFSGDIFQESSNTKFYENLSTESQVVSCRQTDGWKDMTRLTVAFSSYANAPKNYLCVQYVCPLVPGIQLLACYLKQ
jgi:hypothetical protein